MKFLLYYLCCQNFKNEIIDISCREDILKLGEGLLHITRNSIELVLLEDGTKILDDEYLLALEEGTDLFIYPISLSEKINSLFLTKRFLHYFRYE